MIERVPAMSPAELRLAAIAAAKLREKQELALYAAHPWPFFVRRLNLLDPLEPPASQIAPYPSHFAYCEHLVHEFHSYNQIACWKSRRMIGSNSACGYFIDRAAHMMNQRFHLIARVEGENAGEGARELIARSIWMLENLREGPRINFIPHKLSIEFPDTNSLIIGMGGNEPHKMRSLASNGVLCDEFAFWDKPEEAYTALRPTIEGRGKVILMSSTGAGFFKQVVYDETDSWMSGNITVGGRPDSAQDYVEYLPGMDCWTNAGNGIRVIKLLHWADPRKPKGGAWEKQERKGMTDRAFRQEYLCEFNLSSGRPVFLQEWDEKRMVMLDRKIHRDDPLIVSLDFGYNRPAMTIQDFLGAKQWWILRALLGHRTHFTPFVRQCQQLMKLWYPEHDNWVWVGDDAGNQEGRDGPSEVEILKRKFGIKLLTTHVPPKGVPKTIDTIRDFMCTNVAGEQGPEAGFVVARHPSTRIVIDGMNGGYRYPEAKPGKPEPDNPQDDGFYIHIFDTIRYGALNCARPNKIKAGVDLAVEAARGIIAGRDYTV